MTYTARLGFDVTDWLNAYFTYAKGWKASAVNLSSDSRPGARAALPEDVTLYEVGLKTQFDGGFINVALFDQTIDNFQSNLFIGTGFALLNAGEESVRGFEVDSMWAPTESLTLTAGVTYQVTPRFRLGGGVTVKGDSVAESLSDPASRFGKEGSEASVRIESAFSF